MNENLRELYPHFANPIRCENGCGAVIDVIKAYSSYRRGSRIDGEHLAICECCAAEEGHILEEYETPDTAPVCRRKPKRCIK